jgi:FAD/FMN-containing dehydrogenase/Fe-S oxidoreductase
MPRLAPETHPDGPVGEYLRALRRSRYRGSIRTDLGARLVRASDNSIYEQLPKAVLEPRDECDVVAAMRLLGDPRFASVAMAPRGGGTGTDGSALVDGIVIDLARGLDRIVEIDVTRRFVRVQPGVVLAQLNAALAPLGFRFGPTVSPHDRATLGGMIATDAAGKGSRLHGKTSDHVRRLRTVLPGGEVLEARRLEREESDATIAAGGREARLLAAVRDALDRDEVTAALADRWPVLARPLAGYTLPKAFDRATGAIDLAALVCGAEGTLGIVVEAELAIVPLAKHRRMVFVGYRSFDEAVAAAAPLGAFIPSAIETMDETVLALARTDEAWQGLDETLGEIGALGAVNLVEFEGDDPSSLASKAAAMAEAANGSGAATVQVIEHEPARRALWEVRERAVGLLGNMPGDRQPVAFVEDCAVPPERLPEFVREFRAILDRHGLASGMYGHVDAGCLHVRPALDLRDEADERLVREIADEVAALTHRLGGVLWGEHGKGFRSRFNEGFFGPVLMQAFTRIKTAFDPRNQMNPGKIAVPEGVSPTLLTIEASSRGSRDRAIEPALAARHAHAIRCNGNAACQSIDLERAMCPSLKISRDPRHGPRGRAILMREWMRRVSREGWREASEWREPSWSSWPIRVWRRLMSRRDFSHEVREAMDGCLSCKACAGSCPVKVSVPEFRSAFLHHYHRRYARSLGDCLVAGLEEALPRLDRMGGLVNAATSLVSVEALVRLVAGLVNPPRLARPSLEDRLRPLGVAIEPIESLATLPHDESGREAILLQDAFSTYLDPQATVGVVRLLQSLGVRPRVAAYFPSGKGRHVKGELGRFERIARANLARLESLASSGRPIVGIDPATTLVFRDELPKALGLAASDVPKVQLLAEWLDSRPDLSTSVGVGPSDAAAIRLFAHCTARAIAPESTRQWQRVFARFGCELSSEPVGCCGMGGAWGHEAANAADSLGIFGLSWASRMPHDESGWEALACEGFSCRSQIERICSRRVRSPAEVLADRLQSRADG